MLKRMRKQLKNEKGLTLVELLAVIVILGIIAAIAVPAIGNIIDSSRIKAAKADAANIVSAANIYFAENTNEKVFTNEESTKTEGYESYITELGTVETFKVTKSATETALVVETTGKSGGKKYEIETVTLKELEIEIGKESDESSKGFKWTE